MDLVLDRNFYQVFEFQSKFLSTIRKEETGFSGKVKTCMRMNELERLFGYLIIMIILRVQLLLNIRY